MELYHGGKGSGRYPLGSGDRPYQHRGGSYRLKIRSGDNKTRTVSANRNVKDKVSRKAKIAKAKKDIERVGENLSKQDVKVGKDKSPITRGEKLSRNVITIGNETNNLRKTVKNIKNREKARSFEKQERERISKMSDSDLRKEIDRMSLEKRYVDLSREKVSSGRDYVDDIFDGINSAALLTGSIVGTIALIRSLRK